MAVFRIEKTRDYTVMSNYHLRDRSLSLKAKGLLSLMLSLPEDWDYTMKGLARICKDGIDSISGGIRELEAHGYLVRARVRNENGQLGSIEYTILEQPKEPAQTPAPVREKPIRENPIQVKPMLDAPIQENPAQLNTKEQNKELSITQGSSPIPSSPPISTLDELDASLSSVSDKAYSIREGMKTAEQRMKELQKLMEYGRNYQTYKPIQDEYRQIRWKGKQEKFAEARRAELTLWDAANRYLHAHLPEGVKTLPISAWEKEYTALKAQREAEYDTLKETRAEVAELQKIRKCVDIALRADQPEQTQTHTKRHDIACTAVCYAACLILWDDLHFRTAAYNIS